MTPVVLRPFTCVHMKQQCISWLGQRPACRHCCNTYTAAVHLEPSLLVSSSLHQCAFSYISAQPLFQHATAPSINCAAGEHCQQVCSWAAGPSDCSKDLSVALAAGQQSFSSRRLSHTLLSAARSASNGLLELLPAFCYYMLWQS